MKNNLDLSEEVIGSLDRNSIIKMANRCQDKKKELGHKELNFARLSIYAFKCYERSLDKQIRWDYNRQSKLKAIKDLPPTNQPVGPLLKAPGVMA